MSKVRCERCGRLLDRNHIEFINPHQRLAVQTYNPADPLSFEEIEWDRHHVCSVECRDGLCEILEMEDGNDDAGSV